MNPLDTLAQVIDYEASRSVRITPSMCLPRRHRRSGCKRCVEICPTAAISLADGLKIETNKCIECGACSTVCPTGALEAKEPTSVELVNRIAELGANGGPVYIACESGSFPGWESGTCIRTRCLARVDESVLVGAIAQGAREVWLVDGPCARCPYPARRRIFAEAVERANALLALFGNTKRVGIRSNMPAAPEPVGGGTGGSPLSRRDFLRSLVGHTARASTATLTRVIVNPFGVQESRTEVVRGKLPVRVPARRQILIQAMRRLGEPAYANAETPEGNWAQFGVTGACDGCRMCAFFCPTGALRKVPEEEAIGLDFQASMCINCQLCKDACVRKAVSSTLHVRLATVLAETVERFPMEDRLAQAPSLRAEMRRLAEIGGKSRT